MLQESFTSTWFGVFRSFTITNILKFVIPLNCQEKGLLPICGQLSLISMPFPHMCKILSEKKILSG